MRNGTAALSVPMHQGAKMPKLKELNEAVLQFPYLLLFFKLNLNRSYKVEISGRKNHIHSVSFYMAFMEI